MSVTVVKKTLDAMAGSIFTLFKIHGIIKPHTAAAITTKTIAIENAIASIKFLYQIKAIKNPKIAKTKQLKKPIKNSLIKYFT